MVGIDLDKRNLKLNNSSNHLSQVFLQMTLIISHSVIQVDHLSIFLTHMCVFSNGQNGQPHNNVQKSLLQTDANAC